MFIEKYINFIYSVDLSFRVNRNKMDFNKVERYRTNFLTPLLANKMELFRIKYYA